MYYYIYRTTNLINGMFYIGLHHSATPFDPKYYGSGLHLKRAISVHGKHNFKVEPLIYCQTPEELSIVEASLVTNDLVRDPQCYNLRVGGRGGSVKNSLSLESRAKMSASRKSRPSPTQGMKHTAETRAQISASRKGHKLTDAAVAAKRIAHTGLVWWNNGSSSTRSRDCPGEQWTRGRIVTSRR